MATPAEKNAKIGTASPADIGPKAMFEMLGQSRTGLRTTVLLAANDRHGEGQQHPGHGRVDSRGVHQGPGKKASGSSRYQLRTRFCTRKPNRPSGTMASSSGRNDNELV